MAWIWCMKPWVGSSLSVDLICTSWLQILCSYLVYLWFLFVVVSSLTVLQAFWIPDFVNYICKLRRFSRLYPVPQWGFKWHQCSSGKYNYIYFSCLILVLITLWFCSVHQQDWLVQSRAAGLGYKLHYCRMSLQAHRKCTSWRADI